MSAMNRKIAGLAAIAIMMLLVFFQLPREEAVSEQARVLPTLNEQLAAVTEVSIGSLDSDESVTLVKQENGWLVKEKSGYPADFEAVSELLGGLSELRVAERKTAKPENHGRLGVAARGEGTGTLISVQTISAEAGEMLELVVGKPAESRGSFVRLNGEDQVYLTDAVVSADTDVMSFVDAVIINVDSADVQSVAISGPGSYLSAGRSEAGAEMTLENLPVGAELKYDTVADSLARLLINLRFTDVEPYDASIFQSASLLKVTTFSRGEIEVNSTESAGEHWIHLANPDLEQWQYQVSEHTYNELNKSMSDMLKEQEDYD